MPSSYNIIECNRVVENENENKIVETKYELKKRKPFNNKEDDDILSNKQKQLDADEKLFQERYETLSKTMIENARRQSEDIINSAYAKIPQIEDNAYNEAYKKGNSKGYDDGYKKGYEESYEKNIEIAQKEHDSIVNNANCILENANNILIEAKHEYARYLEEKKEEIKRLILVSVESILKKEVLEEDAINSMLFEAITVGKNAKTIIIKCNNKYTNKIKGQVENWKSQLAFSGDLFVIEDNTVSDGNAVIEKNNGKILVGVDIGINKIKEILDGNDLDC